MWKPELHPRDAHGKFARHGGTAAKLIDVAKKANAKPTETGRAHGNAGAQFDKAKQARLPNDTPVGGGAAEPDALGESRALAAAFHAGYTVDSEMPRGDTSASVRRITLSDGTKAILKHTPPEARDVPDVVSQDHLGTLVGRALGIDGIGSAKIDDDTTVTRLVPGVTGSDDVLAKHGSMEAEMKRHIGLKNGAKIGLLDYVINEGDRHQGNYLVDGDTVRPIDHGDAEFLPTYSAYHGRYKEGAEEVVSPFSREHLLKKGSAGDEIHSPFSHAELQTFFDRLKALKPEFEKEGAAMKWQFAMSRLVGLLQTTKE